MIHTYIMKFFNATHRDINNPELLAKREALIDYNNKEWQEWFADFNQAVINTRAELTGKTDLNDRERFLKDMLSDKGIANRFIEIVSQEISSISESIDTKLKDRVKGAKNVINGKDAISEIVTYALTDPRILDFSMNSILLLNVLKVLRILKLLRFGRSLNEFFLIYLRRSLVSKILKLKLILLWNVLMMFLIESIIKTLEIWNLMVLLMVFG